jgi:hypothetical protein
MSRRLQTLILILGIGTTIGVQGQPRHAMRTLERAVAAMNTKRYADAEAILRRLIKQYPRYNDARYELALALAMQRKYDEALRLSTELCDTLQPITAQREQYYQLLGDLYREQDDTTRAFEAYSIGLIRFPNSARLRVQRAVLLLENGLHDSARAEIERAIEADPSYPLSYYWGARVYRFSSEPLWAILYAEIYLNMRPNSSRADEMSAIWYNLFREIVEQYDEKQQIELWQPTKSEMYSSAERLPFPEAYRTTLTECISTLRFNRDFELPIASLDTLLRCFTARWQSKGYDTVYTNILIARYEQLEREGLLGAYVHVLAQFGKPMQFDDYAKKNQRILRRLEQWINRHPLQITHENYMSRSRWQ